jgi:hypothetical protein
VSYFIVADGMPSAGAEQDRIDSRVHHELLRGIVRTGYPPTLGELSGAVDLRPHEVEASLRRLHEGHGLVLHPGTTEVWIAHPFSLSPTAVWVATDATDKKGFWAPCLWCATGIVALAAPSATVHVRIGGEEDETKIRFNDGALAGRVDLPTSHGPKYCTAVGAVLVVVVPSPSWPELLSPQHETLPPACTAHA